MLTLDILKLDSYSTVNGIWGGSTTPLIVGTFVKKNDKCNYNDFSIPLG